MIVKNLDLLESMLYYWKATSEKEKVGELFISSVFQHGDMKCTFSDKFNEDSIQRVLSSISNREIFKPASKEEGRFWNNNMWMLEDLEVTQMMLAPIKIMNADELSREIPGIDLELIFIPGHITPYYVDKVEKKLYVNFFKIMTDFVTGEVNIEGMPVDEYVKQLIKREF